ncbi:MAG TPA: methylated-DNA--[protein]-cysteine S-methyltransferase [Candidatus Dormibacteraeota bacterium]|nr:methylated-DNA--[protein]-cysteine S-methyltransferase [Candidatus Dormibacteraeota bacterium]
MDDPGLAKATLGGGSPVRAPASLLPRVLGTLGLGYWYADLDSPLGPVHLAWGPRGVAALRPAGDPARFEEWFRARTGRPARRAAGLPTSLATRLAAAMGGARERVPVDLAHLGEFARAVLIKTREIPRGEVRPYSWVAREIGRPRAVRAVGNALAHNPVPLLVPCHRVVLNDGRLGSYSCGGAVAKRALLDLEGAQPDALEELARRGVRFWGSPSTGIFCFPSCHRARRIASHRRVEFGSEREAAAAGFRPCRICRPGGPPAGG